MDLDRLNQASEELKKLDAGSDKELAALAKYQIALIAERSGKKEEAIKTLQAPEHRWFRPGSEAHGPS